MASERVTVKVSSASNTTSPSTSMLIVCEVSPSAKATWPEKIDPLTKSAELATPAPPKALIAQSAVIGPAVPAGLTRYQSAAFGSDYQDNFFAAMFNLRKITRHVLEPDGATFRTRDSDFLVSTNRDFHPTDVVEDADGSLIVVDTGPWYKLCCPTSQLAKPDVLGAIYRVRRSAAGRTADPRGTSIQWAASAPPQLAALLEDGVAFPREIAKAQVVVGQGADEEQFEVAVFAGHDHVLAADERDDVALFEKGLSRPCDAEGEDDEQADQGEAHDGWVYRRGQSAARHVTLLRKPRS